MVHLSDRAARAEARQQLSFNDGSFVSVSFDASATAGIEGDAEGHAGTKTQRFCLPRDKGSPDEGRSNDAASA